MINDYKHSSVPKYRTPVWRFIIGITALFALLGWMEERDREHQEEIARLVSMITECAPVIEMGMPIDLGRVQL